MTRLTLKAVNAALRAKGLRVELVRGEGYHYYVFDDGERYETNSVMVYRLNMQTLDAWIAGAQTFVDEINERLTGYGVGGTKE